MNQKDLELYSSALTLSDMECFVYPDLMFSLVLANLMSPLIWRWRQEDCFLKLEGKNPWRRLMRLRQYVMDEFEFNLDLTTWGLTRKDVELNRFKDVISPEDIARSNALFGYTGDRYYFDVNIRRHFGLDQYDGDVIPYWKTETVEAMAAFRRKEGYQTGAGECVSLSALYAAAAFIVCDIPLEDIFLILTPLHSQNFIDIQDGVITNNRRLLTKSMWFNGTEISKKAQRALRNEQVTVVTHATGSIHCFYERATIDPAQYQRLDRLLRQYLDAPLTQLNFANFLRSERDYQKYFQFCRHRRGERMFVKSEVLFGYEHGSPYRILDPTFDKLLEEVEEEDFSPYPIEGRLCCEQLGRFLEIEKIDIKNPTDRAKLARFLSPLVPDAEELVRRLVEFLHIDPRLPSPDKKYESVVPIQLQTDWSREQVMDYLESIRSQNLVADLAFYAYRDMTRCRWEPFLKAAMERSPVSIEQSAGLSDQQVYQNLCQMDSESIYEGPRLAQPDEVANFKTGDGIEKAFYLANVLRSRHPDLSMTVDIDEKSVHLQADRDYPFESAKGLRKKILLAPNHYQAD
ncbi:MAG TPA: hypothetical protein PLX18_00520 [Anaerohalosphaeraceae bacterium]|nr:hypothetical protein [Anaerohalosphaeraceae bacterium]HQG05156.1 hypothetical protein [Anaerohalosphaeraceae bacterium]HQI06330.1 hypothetical protein [Anaerohalosphaeraceae bacterium]HQJ67051.1 hypothetical protein [Anaerohalosphaeraceae bacterium]